MFHFISFDVAEYNFIYIWFQIDVLLSYLRVRVVHTAILSITPITPELYIMYIMCIIVLYIQSLYVLIYLQLIVLYNI